MSDIVSQMYTHNELLQFDIMQGCRQGWRQLLKSGGAEIFPLASLPINWKGPAAVISTGKVAHPKAHVLNPTCQDYVYTIIMYYMHVLEQSGGALSPPP